MAVIAQGMKTKYVQSSKRRRRHNHKRNTFIIRILLCIILLLIVGVAIWHFSYESFHIGDYIKVKYSGFNGKGSADISLKSPPGYDVFLNEVKLKDNASQGHLSNGDIITVDFTYDEDYASKNGLRVMDDSCDIIVEDLPEGIVLTEEDVFSALSVNTEGISPEIKVQVTNESNDVFFKEIEYTIEGLEEDSCFESGESLTITARVPEEAAMEQNYDVPAGGMYEKIYTIPSGSSYLRDESKITESIINTLDEHSRSFFGNASEYGLRIFSEANLMPIWVNGKTTFKWENPRIISAYFTTVSEDKFGSLEYHNNDVKLVYEVNLTQSDGVNCVAEVVVQYTNLIEAEDGSIDLSLDSGHITAASYKNSNIVKLVRSTDDDAYTAIKIK